MFYNYYIKAEIFGNTLQTKNNGGLKIWNSILSPLMIAELILRLQE